MIDEPTGVELRDSAIEAVLTSDEAVHRGRRAFIDKAIDALIEEGGEFTSDDVRARVDPEVLALASPMLLPAVMRALAQSGRVQTIGWTVSTRRSRHCGPLRVWRPTVGEAA
jgi:hypothetical protein